MPKTGAQRQAEHRQRIYVDARKWRELMSSAKELTRQEINSELGIAIISDPDKNGVVLYQDVIHGGQYRCSYATLRDQTIISLARKGVIRK